MGERDFNPPENKCGLNGRKLRNIKPSGINVPFFPSKTWATTVFIEGFGVDNQITSVCIYTWMLRRICYKDVYKDGTRSLDMHAHLIPPSKTNLQLKQHTVSFFSPYRRTYMKCSRRFPVSPLWMICHFTINTQSPIVILHVHTLSFDQRGALWSNIIYEDALIWCFSCSWMVTATVCTLIFMRSGYALSSELSFSSL